MKNLSICPEKNNFLFSPNECLKKKRASKARFKANFLSQVDNRIIEENSPEINKNFFEEKPNLKDVKFFDCFKSQMNSSRKHIDHRKKKSENLPSTSYMFNHNKEFILNSKEEKEENYFLSNPTKNRKLKIFFETFLNKTKFKLEYCFKELIELKLTQKLISPEDQRTKLMIKNIPNKFSIVQLVDLFKEDFKNKFDFVYLVIDPKTECNQGYGFINLCDPSYKSEFFKKYHRTKWPGSKSGKVCEISYAKLQTPEKINEVFVDKYFREWNKYWIEPKLILDKFPTLKNDLITLENIRRNNNFNNYYMNYQNYYGNVSYPFGY